MLRAWREFWNPALRCARLGHEKGVGQRNGTVLPGRLFSRYVCENVTQQRDECVRCRAVLSDWRETDRRGLTGWSGPSEMWARIERGEEWSPSRIVEAAS